MNVQPFALERYFARYEFPAKYMLSSSDIESLSVKELVDNTDSESRQLWENLRLSYTESLGLPLLRQEISKLYTNINESEVLVVVPEEGVFLAMNALLNPGDHLIAAFPGYQSSYELAKSISCDVTYWQPDENNGWRFDPEFLEANIRPNTKLIACNFPHNPTGFLPSKADWEKIIEIARTHNLYLFSDEMYSLLEFNADDHLLSAVDFYDKAISLFGMSKTFGMPGARIGWLVTKDKEAYQKFATLKDYTTICSSAPSEILSLMALRQKDTIIKRHVDLLKTNFSLLKDFITSHSGLFSLNEPKAGSICFPKFKSPEGALAFCDNLVKETGIMLLPSTVYDFGDFHIRIGFGRKNFPEVLSLFEKYLLNYIHG